MEANTSGDPSSENSEPDVDGAVPVLPASGADMVLLALSCVAVRLDFVALGLRYQS